MKYATRLMWSFVALISILLMGAQANAQVTYCSPTYNNTNSTHYISSVSVNGFFQHTPNYNTHDYTSEVITVNGSNSLNFTLVSEGYCGVSIAADWNGDGDFEDTDEFLDNPSYIATSPATYNSTSTIPASVVAGTYRLRVWNKGANAGDGGTPPGSACGTYNYGSWVDYTLEILADCSGAPSAGTLPAVYAACPNVDFTLIATGATHASGLTNSWQSSLDGATWTNISGAINSSYNVIGGVTDTVYYRYITLCNASGISDTTNIMQVTINPVNQCYCIPGNDTGHNISEFTTTNAVNNIQQSNISAGTNGYANLIAIDTISQKQTLSFDFNLKGSNSTTYGSKVWIDWNQNGQFESNEIVYQSSSYSNTHSGAIQIPMTASLGYTRIRAGISYIPNSGPSNACAIDNDFSFIDYTVQILPPPSCMAPINLSAVNITNTTADLSWTEVNSATKWQIEIGTEGFTQGTGTFGIVSVTPDTTITIAPNGDYEFYVRSICTPGVDTSAWEGPYSFTNQYCTATSTSTSYFIKDFTLQGENNSISNLSSGATSGGYSFNNNDTIDVVPSASYNFTAELEASTYTGNNLYIWIDWNHDFSFDASEQVFNEQNSSSFQGSITIPINAIEGPTRVRVRQEENDPCGNYYYGEIEDYVINVLPIPSCIAVTDLLIDEITANSIKVAWTPQGTSTLWTVEWGAPGFVPGTGNALGSLTGVTDTFALITGLNAATLYDIYVQTDCGGGDVSPWSSIVTSYTACGVVMAPFHEGFDNGVQPQCWNNMSIGNSTSDFWEFDGNPGSGASVANNGRPAGTFAWADGSSPTGDSVILVTPRINLANLTTPSLGFEWFSNNTTNPGDNVPLYVYISTDSVNWVQLDSLAGDNPAWQFASYDLSAYTGSTVLFAFRTDQSAASTAYYNDILLDEVVVDNCGGGQDGTKNVCRIDGTVDLNNNIIVKPGNKKGNWSFPGNEVFLTNDSIMNISSLPDGVYELYYVENFACSDTMVAEITVYNASSAGDFPIALSACRNAPINLYDGIGGNVDMGGTWYGPNQQALPNALPFAGEIPGTFNYLYVVSNAACPEDSMTISVTIDGTCDWLAIENEQFNQLSVYPNPTNGELNIVNPSNAKDLDIVVLDMNGRVVLRNNDALQNNTKATISLEKLEKGIYTLKVFNQEGQKIFKVVKQ